MDEDQIISRIAFILSLIAFIGVLVVGCYAYFNEPETADISGIADNRIDIDKLLSDVNNMQKDIDGIPLIEFTEEDLEDLEDNIKDLEKEVEKCAKNYLNEDFDDIEEFMYCLKTL